MHRQALSMTSAQLVTTKEASEWQRVRCSQVDFITAVSFSAVHPRIFVGPYASLSWARTRVGSGESRSTRRVQAARRDRRALVTTMKARKWAKRRQLQRLRWQRRWPSVRRRVCNRENPAHFGFGVRPLRPLCLINVILENPELRRAIARHYRFSWGRRLNFVRTCFAYWQNGLPPHPGGEAQ